MGSVRASDVKNMASIAIDNITSYTGEVCTNRTTPFSNDGLKPVNRALLYAVYQALKNTDKFIKSQTVCSDVIGKYHPHGMDAVYLSAVKMAHDKGSPIESGSVLDLKHTDNVTAPRYTEIRLSPLGKELFSTIDMCEMVDSELGYKMPKNLVARFPYQLFTYNVNIGVGMANNQLPLNPKEVIEALVKMLDNRIEGKDTTTEELMEYIKGPDLYKNTKIYISKESLKHYIEKGVGTCIEVCDVEVFENKGEIHIKEVPYREKSPILSELILRKSNAYHDDLKVNDRDKIKGIKNITEAIKDLSSTENINIVVKVDKPKFTTDYVLNELYTKTNIKRPHTMMLVFVDEETGKLDLLSVRDLMLKSIDVNIEYFKNKYNEELRKLEYSNDVNIVLEKLTRPEHVDFVSKAYYSKDKVKLLNEREGLDLSLDEINEIVFKHAGILKRLSDRDEILQELSEYEGNKQQILDKLKIENILKDTKQYFQGTLMKIVEKMPRDSEIIYSQLANVTPKPRKIIIPDNRYVVIDKNGLLYSVASDEDFDKDSLLDEGARVVYEALEHDSLVIVTENSHIKIPVKDISEDKISINSLIVSDDVRVGNRVIGTFLQKEADTSTIKTSKENKNDTWYFINNLGCIKVVQEHMLYSSTKVTKSTVVEDNEYIVESYKLDDEEIENTLLFIATENGMAKLIPVELFGAKNRASKYNRTILLDEDDSIVYTDLIRKDFTETTLLITDKEGNEITLELDNTFIKGVNNKGVRISRKGIDKIFINTLEKNKLLSSLRITNNENYCTIYK